MEKAGGKEGELDLLVLFFFFFQEWLTLDCIFFFFRVKMTRILLRVL